MRSIAFPKSASLAVLALFVVSGRAQGPYESNADFIKYAEKLRQSAILNMQPQVVVPATSLTHGVSGKYPWKTGIVTTVFWVGGGQKENLAASAWNPRWEKDFGGFDNPKPAARQEYRPISFVPKLNPFYVALPYNDVAKGATKPEAKVVIPWYGEVVANGKWTEGQSVCRDRWVAIRNAAGKVCYAQWSDCGPFGVDHWQYVFGNEKPRPNVNGGAGLNVSPSVRDYLELGSTDVTDWKFVEVADVPRGPWGLYGENNPLVKSARSQEGAATAPAPPAGSKPVPSASPPADGPTIIQGK